MAENLAAFFSFLKCLLGDFAFTCIKELMSAFKKPRGAAILWDHERPNETMKPLRVQLEHCTGILKGRFQTPKEIHPVIMCKQDLEAILEDIACCIVLHNMMLGIETFEVAQEWHE